MTQASAPTTRATPGRQLRFVRRVTDAPAPDPATDIVVLDVTWTPERGERADVRPIRLVFHELLARVDLFNESQERLDAWADEAGLADRMVVDGVTWWFQFRMKIRWDLHERMIWCHVVSGLLSTDHVSIAMPSDHAALVDAAQAAALARPGLTVDAVDPEAPAAPAPARAQATVADRGPMASLRFLGRAARRNLRRLTGQRVSASKRELEDRQLSLDARFDHLVAEPGGALSVASARFFQVIHVAGRRRFVDPHLALVLDRLAASGLPIMTIGLALDHRAERDWAALEGDDHLVPNTVVPARFGRPEDDRITVDDLNARLAEVSSIPLVVAGCDLGPALHRLIVVRAGPRVLSQVRWLQMAERLMAELQPRILFVDHEGVRTLWLAAARRSGIPSVAVQHGVIYPNNPEYCHPRHPALMLPDLTCLFGAYERDLLLDLGGYEEAEVRVTGSSRADPDASRRPATTTERDDVRRELGVRAGDRLLVVSVAHNPVAGDIYSVEMVARLLGGVLPGVHVVFKLHPRERSEAPYEAVLTGLARSGGYAPPAMSSVRDFDLYRLLRSADAHLGLHSTVLTDAVVAGTPNLIAVGQAFSDMLGYAAAGVAVPVGSVDDVVSFMRDPRPLEPTARDAFLARHFEPGDATGRIVDAIGSLLERPPVRVRPATSEDADLLLAWANDETTRAMSFHSEPIDRPTHVAWLSSRLASEATRLSIGLLGPRPIGQVRLEREADGDVEVSIAIAPEARGEGLARPLLRAAMAAAQRSPALGGGRYVARVRPENAASIALFESAGFRRVASGADADGLVFALPVGAPLEDADRQPVEAGVLVQESGPA